jgi:hypothetical protein
MFKIISSIFVIFALSASVDAGRMGRRNRTTRIDGAKIVEDLNLINSGDPNSIVQGASNLADLLNLKRH